MSPQDIAALPLPWQWVALDKWTDSWLKSRDIDPDAFWARVETEQAARVGTSPVTPA